MLHTIEDKVRNPELPAKGRGGGKGQEVLLVLESSPLHDTPQCDSSNKLNNNKTAIILVEFNRFTHALYE